MSEIDEETIASIVEDAMNSAIPEPWEVSKHAAQRVLALVLPAIERARVEGRALGAKLERDRCLSIAKSFDGEDAAPGNGHWEWGAYETARDIIAAISKADEGDRA